MMDIGKASVQELEKEIKRRKRRVGFLLKARGAAEDRIADIDAVLKDLGISRKAAIAQAQGTAPKNGQLADVLLTWMKKGEKYKASELAHLALDNGHVTSGRFSSLCRQVGQVMPRYTDFRVHDLADGKLFSLK